MLTPAFELSQDEEYVTIHIKVPFARVSDAEIFIEENEFRFHSKPYFLRLTLPGNIIENAKASAVYDADQGSFTVRVPKETPGEKFEGLDMITKLLTSKGTTSAKQPLIEVLGEDNEEINEVEGGDKHNEDLDEEFFDWHVEQNPFVEEEILLDAPKYGFANQRSGVFTRLQKEISDIVDIKEPDKVCIKDRRYLRLENEDSKFDEDYYLADLYQDEMIQHVRQYKSPWQLALDVQFTELEKEKMMKLPKKEYLLDENVLPSVYLGLTDLLFAFAYNHRITDGENNVESSWNICKLSSTLSWLETFTNIEDVVVACLRRSLCFPLYRHWDLANLVLKDTQQILSQGKQRILKCLLEVHTILSESYPRYILNDLYVTDYCVWIQSSSDKRLRSLHQALEKINIQKADLGFGLLELEAAARIVQEEDCADVDSITDQVAHVQINGVTCNNSSDSNKLLKDSDDDSSESSDDSSCSDDGDTDSDDECRENDDVCTENDDVCTENDEKGLDTSCSSCGVIPKTTNGTEKSSEMKGTNSDSEVMNESNDKTIICKNNIDDT